jgi:hypothetical protein
MRCVEIRIDQDRMLQLEARGLALLMSAERLAMLVSRRAGVIPRRRLGRESWRPSMVLPLLSHALVIVLVDSRKSFGRRKNFEVKE